MAEEIILGYQGIVASACKCGIEGIPEAPIIIVPNRFAVSYSYKTESAPTIGKWHTIDPSELAKFEIVIGCPRIAIRQYGVAVQRKAPIEQSFLDEITDLVSTLPDSRVRLVPKFHDLVQIIASGDFA